MALFVTLHQVSMIDLDLISIEFSRDLVYVTVDRVWTILIDNIIWFEGSNPNKDAPCLEVEFDRFAHSTVVYPDSSQVEEYGKFITDLSSPGQAAELLKIDASQAEGLHEIHTKDPLSELSEQEKDLLWQLRHVCCKKVPDALPKLLDAVKWNNRDEVAQVNQCSEWNHSVWTDLIGMFCSTAFYTSFGVASSFPRNSSWAVGLQICWSVCP